MSRARTTPLRYRLAGVGVSMLFHGGVFVLVLSLGVVDWVCDLLNLPKLTVQPAIQAARAEPIEYPNVIHLQLVPGLPGELAAVAPTPEGEELAAGLSDPRWQELVEPVAEARLESAGTFVSAELARIARESEGRSTEENLDKLAELSGKLNSVSSDEAVGDINAQLRRVLGAGERAERPSDEPVAGEFDFATAQMHDVTRQDDGQGGYTYTAILVDSAGRKFESPMDVSSGETAYRTMQLVKSNPLLEKVYRGVVMSMMDQILKGAK